MKIIHEVNIKLGMETIWPPRNYVPTLIHLNFVHMATFRQLFGLSSVSVTSRFPFIV
jgi:hypothetical protein